MLTQERLKELLHYDLDTGVFIRLKSTYKRYIGKVAGNINKDSYVVIYIDGKPYYGHRLAFLYMTGSIPYEVEHKDTIKHHNWWTNLRAATHSENQCNHKLKSSNTSGYKGVHWHKGTQKWLAQGWANKKYYYLGIFINIEDAVKARNNFAKQHHGDFFNPG